MPATSATAAISTRPPRSPLVAVKISLGQIRLWDSHIEALPQTDKPQRSTLRRTAACDMGADQRNGLTQITDNPAAVRDRCHMPRPKVPTPKDVKAAAQAVAETAQ